MFDHVAIAVSDLAASEGFYRTALSVLGVEPSDADAELVEWEDWDIGATDREHPVTRGLHVGFRARDRAQVDAFWQAGIDAGYRDDGAPGPRTHYGPTYYGGFPARPGWVLQFVESAHGPSSRPYLTLRPRLRRTDQFGADGKREFVRQAIEALVAEGYLAESDGPRGAWLLAFVKPVPRSRRPGPLGVCGGLRRRRLAPGLAERLTIESPQQKADGE